MDNFFKNNGFVGGITIVVVVLAILVILWNKFVSKNSGGTENMYNQMKWYGNTQNPRPSNSSKQNSVVSNYQNVNNQPSSTTNSNDLLPKDTNSEWAQLNPSGLGELSNINLLKSGWQVGVDTIGQSLRNANLQLRSEPPNPQTPVGPWNQSTITPDFMRVPLELGQGYQ
jgi:hypothetical protein